jgi:hypothetical protein
MMLDPQAVLPGILIRSAAEAEDREAREVSRWAGPLWNVFCARLLDYANEQSRDDPPPRLDSLSSFYFHTVDYSDISLVVTMLWHWLI